MHTTNPLVIPRNHMVEEALKDANNGNITSMINLIKVLEKPYSDQENISKFQLPSSLSNEKYQTFCGT